MIALFLIFYAVVAAGLAVICMAIFRFLLRPLSIPKSFPAELKRERLLSFLIFLGLCLSIYGVVVYGLVYLIGLIRHLRLQTRNAGAQHAEQVRIIPRFTLSDLLVMVFSLGVMPLVFQLLTWETDRDASMVILALSLALFPSCFLCALYRLEHHKVPSGFIRAVTLGVTPYAALAVVSIPCAALLLLLMNTDNMSPPAVPPVDIPLQILIWIFLSVTILGLTRLVYSRAATVAKRAADTPTTNPASTE